MKLLRRALFVLLPLLAGGPAAAEPSPQYVLISFDGARDNAQWQRSRTLARKTGAHFTYFLSCVGLLTRETRTAYRGPEGYRSNVGYAASRDDIAVRLREIWTARLEGHEIASHACGHLDGGKWSAAAWHQEFNAFTSVLKDAWSINAIPYEPEGWKEFAAHDIVGFRAPYLSTGKGLETALVDSAFAYDASGVSRDPEVPEIHHGIEHFALPMIPEGPGRRRVLAMDYNLFVRHSGGNEQPDTDGVFEQRTYDAFREAFEHEYGGKRQPLQIGLHFTLMNGGAYWRALERFAGEVCARADVRCVSYRDYLAETAKRPS